jgi:hypothetical protein
MNKRDEAMVVGMLKAGWHVKLFANAIGSFTALATHARESVASQAHDGVQQMIQDPSMATEYARQRLRQPKTIETDDRTPELAIIRLAYKVHGQIIQGRTQRKDKRQ